MEPDGICQTMLFKKDGESFTSIFRFIPALKRIS